MHLTTAVEYSWIVIDLFSNHGSSYNASHSIYLTPVIQSHESYQENGFKINCINYDVRKKELK